MKYYCDNARHLICVPYTLENLHVMATDLGIKKCWYHASAKYKHYDIPKRRIQEITDKCELISSKQLLELIKDSDKIDQENSGSIF